MEGGFVVQAKNPAGNAQNFVCDVDSVNSNKLN